MHAGVLQLGPAQGVHGQTATSSPKSWLKSSFPLFSFIFCVGKSKGRGMLLI